MLLWRKETAVECLRSEVFKCFKNPLLIVCPYGTNCHMHPIPERLPDIVCFCVNHYNLSQNY